MATAIHPAALEKSPTSYCASLTNRLPQWLIDLIQKIYAWIFPEDKPGSPPIPTVATEVAVHEHIEKDEDGATDKEIKVGWKCQCALPCLKLFTRLF